MSGQRVDVKVVMLGKEYVGKTSLVERYVHDRFLVGPYQNTIGAAFVAKVMCVGDRTVTLGIWDTAGSERYEAMSRIYYRGAKAAIVCYDLTDSSSFERAKFWVKELRSLEEGCQIYLCGTKSDLLEEDRRRRRVDFHDVQDYADNIKAQLFETSSKTGQSVDELFQKVAEDYVSVAAFQVMTVTSLVDRGQRCGFEPEGKPLLLQLLSSLSHDSSGPVELDEFPERLDLTLVWAGMVKRLSYSRCLSQQRWHLPVLAHGTEAVLG
ncbi:ras-related protein Rab-24 isoform X1 [Mus caroli]|uniref:Ras-related protein Rab-24 n=1 Tax=Mus caroli TaxID=10089 RepID=A0A6P7QHJ2_MUSCR|nr:ras-related protein Rab-24 isoform X1 [Mus caroli]